MPSSYGHTGYGPGKPRVITLSADHAAVPYPYPVIYRCTAALTLTLPLASADRENYSGTVELEPNIDVDMDLTTNTVTMNGQSANFTLYGSSVTGDIRSFHFKPAASGEDYTNPNPVTAY